MSVFSLDAKQGNPVTTETLEDLCSQLGVKIYGTEKEDYRRLLAVFHDASEQLMAMDGETYVEHARTSQADSGRLCSSSGRGEILQGEHPLS